MTASLETFVIAAYVFAEALSIPRSGPAGKTTDQELIALSVAQAIIGIPSDRQFLGVVEKLLPGFFLVAELIAQGHVRLVDGTLISCANYPGCAPHSAFAGHASFGYCPSESQFV
jgi:hypothetical protein